MLDLKGLYVGTPVDVETDPELYAAVAAAFPDAYIEDPDLNDETTPVLEPYHDRVTWDAPLHSLADVKRLARKAINSKPSRFGSLRELLGYAGLEPPYLLVAHSLGGLFANLFARLYPQEVAAVLFLEATHPDDQQALRKHESQLVRALGKLLTGPEIVFKPNVQAELACVQDTVREIASAGGFPQVPVRVITGGLTPKAFLMSPGAVGAKRANQQALARLSPQGEQVIAQQSGHFPQMTQPQLVLRVLRDVIALL